MNTKEENKKIKVLNLYAGIGGNRKLWTNVDVTAVENVPEIAKIYQDFFPEDTVIIADAHQYLLEHYKEFDFIWSSPPCQSHSIARFWASKGNKYPAVYPDMNLYQEIIFLDNFYDGFFAVENTKGYYKPLVKPQSVGRHFIWANFKTDNFKEKEFPKDSIKSMQKLYGINISKYKIEIRKDQVLRNCVNPELGLHVFNMAFKEKQEVLI